LSGDNIPVVETYRGVGIHDEQPRERIETVVKPEIDRVIDLGDVRRLFDFASDARNSPEARLLAGMKIEAIWQLKAEAREVRPAGITLENVHAVTAGLNSAGWRSRTHYGTLLDVREGLERETPIADDG
jgi:hypothetical protein